MAGSWHHMTDDAGNLRDVEEFHGMLDTGGDVYEAAEECHGMIWLLAYAALARFYEPAGPVPREAVLRAIRAAQKQWEKGRDISRGQRPEGFTL